MRLFDKILLGICVVGFCSCHTVEGIYTCGQGGSFPTTVIKLYPDSTFYYKSGIGWFYRESSGTWTLTEADKRSQQVHLHSDIQRFNPFPISFEDTLDSTLLDSLRITITNYNHVKYDCNRVYLHLNDSVIPMAASSILYPHLVDSLYISIVDVRKTEGPWVSGGFIRENVKSDMIYLLSDKNTIKITIPVPRHASENDAMYWWNYETINEYATVKLNKLYYEDIILLRSRQRKK